MKIYSDEFKSEIVKKHLMPGGKSVAVLSKEIGGRAINKELDL